MDLYDLLTEATIATEGLEPGQTPIRITNPTMRGWNTIQGVPINKKAKISKGRENFFYVDEPSVPVVIRKQWEAYNRKQPQFKLNPNSTVEDYIKVFDQQNPINKIKYLQKKGIDTTKPFQHYIDLNNWNF